MRNEYIYKLLLLVLIACNNPKSKDTDFQYDTDNNVSMDSSQDKDNNVVNDTYLQNQQTDYKYFSINYPDTALAYFLYETHGLYKPFEYQEEYQRFDLEYEEQISLFKSLFYEKEDLEDVIKNIELNRKRFIDTIRNQVYLDFKKYHGISGMSFDFMLNRNDSIVEPLLYKLLEDQDAPQSEKEYAKSILKKHFNDSTFNE